jgi:hypothetical protein
MKIKAEEKGILRHPDIVDSREYLVVGIPREPRFNGDFKETPDPPFGWIMNILENGRNREDIRDAREDFRAVQEALEAFLSGNILPGRFGWPNTRQPHMKYREEGFDRDRFIGPEHDRGRRY